jgi:hypothetical protein
MSENETLAGDAGERFKRGAGVAFEDAMLRRLRYHLLRLTLVGLSREEVEQLSELARLAFEDADVTDQVTAIRQRPDVSPLASAIAAIVERVEPDNGARAGRADVMVGAILGAYAGLSDSGGGDQMHAAVGGAIGGAIAASVSGFVQQRIVEVGAADYLRMDESS